MSSLISCSMYQSDYRHWGKEIPRQGQIVPKVLDPPPKRSNYRPVETDMEILQPFKSNAHVPFNLLHRKKQIVNTNPHDPIPNVKLEDKMFELKLKARSKRHPVYMVPQISLDNIPQNVMYGENGKSGLVSSLYSSDWKKISKLAIDQRTTKVKNPDELQFEKKDLIDRSIERTRSIKSSKVPPMDPALNKYLPNWYNNFPIEFVDTTKIFWEKNQHRGLCPICDPQPTAKGLSDGERTELDVCLKEDALRTPYTLHPPGYTGYVPRLAVGIPFRKKIFTKYDRFVTSLMESQCVFENKP